MAIELHIQIDTKRKEEDYHIASVINDEDVTYEEINILIAELERAKLKLLNINFDDNLEVDFDLEGEE